MSTRCRSVCLLSELRDNFYQDVDALVSLTEIKVISIESAVYTNLGLALYDLKSVFISFSEPTINLKILIPFEASLAKTVTRFSYSFENPVVWKFRYFA